jgi:hypothetical protein
MNSVTDIPIARDGLSHSEIPGSRCVCHSPRLIAAYHVLRRQPMPRHPPYTLSILIQLPTSRRNDVLHQQEKCQRAYAKLSTGGGRLTTNAHGADRNRTCDIMLAKHALSQLSYSPNLYIVAGFPGHPTSRRSRSFSDPGYGPGKI